MKNREFINEQEIRKAIAQLKPNNELFEIRIIKGKKTISGYFKDADTLINKLDTIDLRNSNVYITLNEINPACFNREQSERFIEGPKESTHDTEILGYDWLMIDFDPERISGTSSSREEFKEACLLAGKVARYLQEQGFEEPVKAISGNGAHLLYSISLKNTEENKELVGKVLKSLDMMFSTDKVKVDVTTFNPSRVCKLYGTLAQKGTNSPDRPHRMSHLNGDVKPVKSTDIVYLEKIVEWLPKEPEKPAKYNNYKPSEFDLVDFMSRNSIRYKTGSAKDSTMYMLEECPFNPAHKDGDAKIFHYTNGAIAFKCHHNSCAQYKWQDVRVKFEPDAYEKEYIDNDQRIEEGWRQHNRLKSKQQLPAMAVDIETINEPIFENARMIFDKPTPEEEYIPSGINIIDKKMKGLQKGRISVVSGLRAAAKSTFISGIINNAIEQSHTTIIYSGELTDKNFLKWLMMQAGGKAHTKPYEKYDGYYLEDDVKPQIVNWMGDYMWLYNNNCGNDFKKIGELLKTEIQRRKADLCIIDNLMALDLSQYSADKYEAQTQFVWCLKEIAANFNVHIIFVAHPRKATGFLRLDDISGSGNIANIVDDAFIIHRKNADFIKRTKEMFAWPDTHEAYSGTNVIEICKNRENGVQDEFIPLWYEPESKRLKNYPAENIVFGWDKDEISKDGFVSNNLEAPKEWTE